MTPLAFSLSWFALLAEVVAVDLLLGGDNALLIAMACRDLPAAFRHRAMLLGSFGAVIARLVLALIASTLIDIPSLRLVGGLLLATIAINLALPPKDDDQAAPFHAGSQIFGVGLVIIVSDLVMSLDNVVALAAITRGDYLLLALGLVLSIPALMWGAVLMTALLKRHPWTVEVGAALLGWIAGDFAISDRLYADWLSSQSPALSFAVPLAMSIYVVAQARILAQGPRRKKPVVIKAVLPVAAKPVVVKPAEIAPQPPSPPPAPAPVPTPEPKPVRAFAPAPADNTPVKGPERYVLWVFAGLFITIAIILMIAIFAGNGSDG